MAETQRDAAVMAADVEVKIVLKTKTVGPVDDQTSITVDGVAKTRTIGEVTTITGLLLDRGLDTSGVRDVHGRLVAPVDDERGSMLLLTGDAERDAATPSIGFTYDSSDDTARLTLITGYLGSQKQMQFVRVGVAGSRKSISTLTIARYRRGRVYWTSLIAAELPIESWD